MKRTILLSLLSLWVAMGEATAAVLFFDDFESGAAFAGNYLPGSNGVRVLDPIQGDVALSFAQVNSAGDLFTSSTFSAPSNLYKLSFDYLGNPAQGGVPGNLGGYIGYVYGLPGSSNHEWLAGTLSCCGGDINFFRGTQPADILPDDGQWHHIEITFSAYFGSGFRLMLEDCCIGYANALAGDVYFDNLKLESVEISAPATGLMILTGLGLVSFLRRRASAPPRRLF